MAVLRGRAASPVAALPWRFTARLVTLGLMRLSYSPDPRSAARRRGFRISAGVVLTLGLMAASPPPRAGGAASDSSSRAGIERRAAMIRRWADQGVYDGSVEARQRAIRDLDEIIALDPLNGEHWLILGRIYRTGEFDSRARACLRRATVLMPRESRAWLALGRAWKREWIRGQDTLAARFAEGAFDTACLVRPRSSENWLALVPMRYERGDRAGALDAARRALALRRGDPEAALAVAYLSYRSGDIERADTLFRDAIPRLRSDLRALLYDPSKWFRASHRSGRTRTSPQGAMSAPEHDAEKAEATQDADIRDLVSRTATLDSAAAFWGKVDPDPTTVANEMQLEYWSRVAHAWFVFWDQDRPMLDSRAITFVRYGPPDRVEINPEGVPLAYAPIRRSASPHGGGVLDYPMHVQGWFYPELGMRVVLNDRSLRGRFTPQVARDFDPLSVPDPDVLARRPDLVTFGDGLAVFPTLPPRDQRIELRGTLVRFESERGPRLLVQVRAEARPDDRLTGRWLVFDREGRELAGSSVELGVSSCDPAEWRLAEVAAELPAGAASVALSVRDARRRRGIFRAETAVATPGALLAISDVVLCCGDPASLARSGLVQFEANMEGRVSGRNPVAAYFEIYRLAAGADGLSHFEYEYRVRRLPAPGSRPPRGGPPVVLSSQREETNAGPHRRQFVSVPITSLARGRYRLEIIVRDRTTGAQVEGATEFDRE